MLSLAASAIALRQDFPRKLHADFIDCWGASAECKICYPQKQSGAASGALLADDASLAGPEHFSSLPPIVPVRRLRERLPFHSISRFRCISRAACGGENANKATTSTNGGRLVNVSEKLPGAAPCNRFRKRTPEACLSPNATIAIDEIALNWIRSTFTAS